MIKNNKQNNKNKFQIFNFNNTVEAPSYKINKGRGLVEWGKNNLYPAEILELYNSKGSNTHKAIIDRKVKMIAGYGIKESENEALNAFVEEHQLNKLVRKLATNFELFDGFSIEIIWNKGGNKIVEINHIPIDKLRFGIESDEINFSHFWFSNDWSKYRKEDYTPVAIPAFNSNKKQGKQIVYHTNYNPESNLYPIVPYSNSIEWLMLDHSIRSFHLNSAKNGYYPSFILAMNNGYPTQEEMDEFSRQFDKNFKGEENSGSIFITYAEGSDQKPELIKVDLNDSDKRFNLLKEQTKEEIIIGHSIPPQLLLSVAGKLASDSEREELKEEFQELYVADRQRQIEEVINQVLIYAGFDEGIELCTYADHANEKEQKREAPIFDAKTLIEITSSLRSGSISNESAIAILQLIYNYPLEEAKMLLGIIDNTNLTTD